MKALIFAAGLGTRLKPITDSLPKALVPVAGKPLIEHVCRKLMASDIDEAVVNVHHFADKIEAWAQLQSWVITEETIWRTMPSEAKEGKIFIRFSDERQQLLETGGAVLHARKYLDGCGQFLIHNVDILSNADLNWFASETRPEAVATLLVSERKSSRCFLFHPETMRLVGWKNLTSGECIMTDETIKADDCKAYAFSGIHILSDKVPDLMEDYVASLESVVNQGGIRFSIRDFYLWTANRHPIYGVLAEDLQLLDVGKLDSLELAEKFLTSY